MDAVVQLDDVTVIYGKNQALKNVSAKFAKGAVGLLGPNGAGKSTMLKALLGFVKPDQGRMTVLDMDVAHAPLAIRARIGYMPESDSHIPGMNAVSFVAYCGQLAGLPAVDAMQRAHEVLYYVGLGEARYRNIETYSTGMKQRIKLAQALVHDPDLLFLDEPTNGMDPKGRDAGADRRAEGARRPRLRAARQRRFARLPRAAGEAGDGSARHRRRRDARVRARRARQPPGDLQVGRGVRRAGTAPAPERAHARRRLRQGGRGRVGRTLRSG